MRISIMLLTITPFVYILFTFFLPLIDAASSIEDMREYLEEGERPEVLRVFTLLGIVIGLMTFFKYYLRLASWADRRLLGNRNEEIEKEYEEDERY